MSAKSTGSRGLVVETQAKALELELRIAELFRRHGYRVRHNAWLRGRSGVRHQVDVYAVYRAPLHTDRIVVECKAYERPVDKDRVMKLAQVVQDLGVEKGILVTTSRFTSAAEATAAGLNIDLWDSSKLAGLLSSEPLRSIPPGRTSIRHIPPLVGDSRAAAEAARSLGGFLPPRLRGCIQVYVPYYLVEEARAEERRLGLLGKTMAVEIVEKARLIDALTGTEVSRDTRTGTLRLAGRAFEPAALRDLLEGAPPYGVVVKPRVEPPRGGELLYYPYHLCILEKRGRTYLVAVDSTTGKPNPRVSRTLAEDQLYREIMAEAEKQGLAPNY